MSGSREYYINYRRSKSQEILEDAILLARNNRWNSCVNRLYYSSYYLVSALLYQSNVKADTHNGVKTQFFLHYIKTGILRRDLGKLYAHLFDWRQESDYTDFIEFDEETIAPVLAEVEDFNKQVSKLFK